MGAIQKSDQDEDLMAKEVPITLATKPYQPPSNRRSTNYKLQNEYLNDVPGLLRSINKNVKDKGHSVVTDHKPLAALPNILKEHAMTDPGPLNETTYPISCILKSQSYMGEDGECRFQELFDDKQDGDILPQQENPAEKCTYERQLSMEIDEL